MLVLLAVGTAWSLSIGSQHIDLSNLPGAIFNARTSPTS